MGRQDGVIKLTGQVGGISFYKTREGYIARQKSGPSRDRIKNDPAFERTRENGEEFGRAGTNGKLLRTALIPLILNGADSRMTGRLTREILKVIQADVTGVRGQRQVTGTHLGILKGFEFNENARLEGTLLMPYSVDLDRTTGTVRINLPSFIPRQMIASPPGASHARLMAAGVEVNFPGEQYVMGSSQSELFVLGEDAQPDLTLSQTVTGGTILPVLVALGIAFYQEVNGQWYPLKNGAYNALSLVHVDGGA